MRSFPDATRCRCPREQYTAVKLPHYQPPVHIFQTKPPPYSGREPTCNHIHLLLIKAANSQLAQYKVGHKSNPWPGLAIAYRLVLGTWSAMGASTLLMKGAFSMKPKAPYTSKPNLNWALVWRSLTVFHTGHISLCIYIYIRNGNELSIILV